VCLRELMITSGLDLVLPLIPVRHMSLNEAGMSEHRHSGSRKEDIVPIEL